MLSWDDHILKGKRFEIYKTTHSQSLFDTRSNKWICKDISTFDLSVYLKQQAMDVDSEFELIDIVNELNSLTFFFLLPPFQNAATLQLEETTNHPMTQHSKNNDEKNESADCIRNFITPLPFQIVSFDNIIQDINSRYEVNLNIDIHPDVKELRKTQEYIEVGGAFISQIFKKITSIFSPLFLLNKTWSHYERLHKILINLKNLLDIFFIYVTIITIPSIDIKEDIDKKEAFDIVNDIDTDTSDKEGTLSSLQKSKKNRTKNPIAVAPLRLSKKLPKLVEELIVSF
ncbi:hypothetical protein RFI_12287 [Reticulomyxa filosa]|uniref:Uncharacterized protein n=1 Tax=Reticulomyxa filosa TaxID=46433 RepID=X6NG05_RETFI|nr:hypothetical protein RFI_12287 [Reticulomyxa filosa]|eukprot:ETO24871.1 hypothetical protein RFI_12287 [Reticulomyxa filosa]